MNDLSSAALDEFTILYTNQVVQKSKCWNEGFLKFHTFNRRAILYDEERCLLDDTFLGKSSLKVGDHVRFDRHLVTIETKICHTVRDLTPLYERKGTRNYSPASSTTTIRNTGSPISHLHKRPRLSTHCTAGVGLRRPALTKSASPDGSPDRHNPGIVEVRRYAPEWIPDGSRGVKNPVNRPKSDDDERNIVPQQQQPNSSLQDEDAMFKEIVEIMSQDGSQEIQEISNNSSTTKSKAKSPKSILEMSVNPNSPIDGHATSSHGKGHINKGITKTQVASKGECEKDKVVVVTKKQKNGMTLRAPLSVCDGNSPRSVRHKADSKEIGTVTRAAVPSIHLNRSLLRLPKVSNRSKARPLMQSYRPASKIVQERNEGEEEFHIQQTAENEGKITSSGLIKYDNVYEDEDLNDMDFGDILATQPKTIESSCLEVSKNNDNNNNNCSNSSSGAFDEDDSHVLYGA